MVIVQSSFVNTTLRPFMALNSDIDELKIFANIINSVIQSIRNMQDFNE